MHCSFSFTASIIAQSPLRLQHILCIMHDLFFLKATADTPGELFISRTKIYFIAQSTFLLHRPAKTFPCNNKKNLCNRQPYAFLSQRFFYIYAILQQSPFQGPYFITLFRLCSMPDHSSVCGFLRIRQIQQPLHRSS